MPNPGAWSATRRSLPSHAVRHGYPLAVRDHGLGTAISLLMRSLPYALARFGILLGYAVACIIWIVVAFGGAAWLGTHIAGAFGFVWLVMCLVGVGWFWGTILRYVLHLLACGHVAVLTELITRGQVGNGSESMLAYGKRVVTERFGQVNALFALEPAGARHPAAFHRTLDWIARNAADPRPGEPGQPGQHHPARGDALPRQGDPFLQPGAQRPGPVARRARGHRVLLPRTPSRS